MTVFLRSGATVAVRSDDSLTVSHVLDNETYIIRKNAMTGEIYLETTNAMEFHGKIYGNIESRVKRIMDTFADRTSSTGILLSGEKGSGKSTLMRLVIAEGHLIGIPTVIINDASIEPTELTTFLATIEQEVIIVLDEFEKVFNSRSGNQEGFLPLLDGMFSSKKLFILGANDRWAINDFMINRPGRIYYHFKYTGLEEEFIRGYCEDTLYPDYQVHIDEIVNISGAIKAFNFDMMKALVEEINRYGETPKEAIGFLNIEPSDKGDRFRIVKLTINDVPVAEHNTHLFQGSSGSIFNPQQTIWLQYKAKGDEGDDDYNWTQLRFESKDLLKIEDGTYIFKKDDFRIEVMFDDEKQTDWAALL